MARAPLSTASPLVKLIAILLGLILSLSIFSPSAKNIDNYCYDLFFEARGAYQTPKEIVIVAIDENSFDEIDLQWPWPRSLHGELLNSLFRAGAKVVAFDLFFAEPSLEDKVFADAISFNQHVVLVSDISVTVDPHYGYEQRKVIEPNSLLDFSSPKPLLGFANMQAETDGFVRKLQIGNEGELAFSYVAAKQYAELMNLSLSDISAKERELGRWIDFLGPPRSIRTISYYQALNPEEYLPKDALKDSLVFVGFATASEATTRPAAIDHYPAPFSRGGSGYYPGVEIHAQAAAGFLGVGSINRFDTTKAALAGITLAAFGGAILVQLSVAVGTLIWLMLLGGGIAAALHLFSSYGLYISPLYILTPITLIFFINPFLQYWLSLKERRFIRDAFSTYLTPQVVRQIISDPKKLSLGGEEYDATTFFLDIAGFTAMSEKLSAKELIEVINRNLGALSEVILKHEGMIDKFIGDCIMASWGIPVSTDDHAARACRAAVEIKNLLPELQEEELKRTGMSMAVRIGMSSGKVVAGNVGGGQRFNYTSLGNEVNLAARLEAINKLYGTTIIVSEQTATRLESEFVFRKLDRIRVVGQQTPVEIFELCCLASELSEALQANLDLYHKGLEDYFKRNFEDAIKHFQALTSKNNDDNAAWLLFARCKEFLAHPPTAEWDGVHSMTEK